MESIKELVNTHDMINVAHGHGWDGCERGCWSILAYSRFSFVVHRFHPFGYLCEIKKQLNIMILLIWFEIN